MWGIVREIFQKNASFKLKIKVGFYVSTACIDRKVPTKALGENGWAGVGAWELFIWLERRWEKMLEVGRAR